MTAAVHVKIAKYFETMHNQVWKQAQLEGKEQPVPMKPPYHRLSELQQALLKNYMTAFEMFDPLPRPCTSDDQCTGQKEQCINGECRTPISTMAAEYVGRCDSDDDCPGQKEICVNGFCWPLPYDVAVPPDGFQEDQMYRDTLEKSLYEYYARIHNVLTNGLGRKPRKIVEVRNFLMGMYADVLAAAGWRHKCEKDDDCPHQGHVCVKGYCVPVPFQLIFKAAGELLPPPWRM